MPLGPGKGLDKTGLLGERPEQPHGFLLAREVLAVHERHVQEPALERLQLTIEAARNRILRRCQRACVARKCRRGIAGDVARELIEDDHAGERAARHRAPFAQPARDRDVDRVAEAAADQRVEGGILAKPLRAPANGHFGVRNRRTEPEFEHRLG